MLAESHHMYHFSTKAFCTSHPGPQIETRKVLFFKSMTMWNGSETAFPNNNRVLENLKQLAVFSSQRLRADHAMQNAEIQLVQISPGNDYQSRLIQTAKPMLYAARVALFLSFMSWPRATSQSLTFARQETDEYRKISSVPELLIYIETTY